MPTIRSSRLALAALAVVAIACGDPTRARATFASSLASYTLYALTGAPSNVPTALLFLGGPTRADRGFLFDVAFDLDDAGRTRVFPVRTVASALAGQQKRVGLQVVSGSFESVREVPRTGYDTLAIQTITAGTVVAVEMIDQQACFSTFSAQTIYAKFVVDSVNLPSRRIHVRAVVDPNCGYRDVRPDTIPDN